MAYNKAREEQKWKKWKEREEEKLRELGMDEVSIQVLHESDWADFNSERRYREHQMPLLDYVEMLLAETEVSETQIQSVEELLDANTADRCPQDDGLCAKGDQRLYQYAGADDLYETEAIAGKNKKSCES